jgi:hypothetical protein
VHRSAKWFGFVVAASLLAGACGGDGSSTTENAPADTTTEDSATADTAADDGDRDRNVQVGGWGTNASGVSTTKLGERSWSHARSSVVRRQRVDATGAIRVVYGTDVFVVSRLVNEVGSRSEVTLIVAGFDTSNGDTADYPIESIGENGVVRIELTDKSDGVDAMPIAWTVVSRDLFAVFFSSNSGDAGSAGVVEYYNLATGQPATNVGDNGRTSIATGLGFDFVTDFGLRSVDDDGTPHFTVVGLKADGDNYAEIVAAGFTPDGRPDPAVGGPTGTVSISSEAINGKISWASLADPGLGMTNGSRIGVVVESSVEMPAEAGFESNLTFVVIGFDAEIGALSYPGSGSFSAMYSTPQDGVPVWNAAFSDTDSISAHVTERGVDEDRELILDLGREGGRVTTAAFNWPDETAEGFSASNVIVDVAAQGKKFVVRQATLNNTQLTIVCFDVRNCGAPANRHQVSVGERAVDLALNVDAMAPEEAGLTVVLSERDQRSDAERYSLATFDVTGVKFSASPTQFDDMFNIYEANRETNESTRTGRPVFVGSDTVVALKTDYEPRTTMSLMKQKNGDDANVVTPSLPLGIERYVDDTNLFARLGTAGVALVAHVANSDTDTFERRLYRVSTENGSVDTAFGTDGYVQSPVPVEDDRCGHIERLLGGSTSVTSLIVDYDQISADPTDGCADLPAEVTWQTFTSTGTAVTKESRARFAGLVTGEPVNWAADAQGNLFVAVRAFVDRVDGTKGSELRVAKFTPAGTLDPTFGTGGLAVVTTLADVWGVSLAVDSAGHVYVGGTAQDEAQNINLTVVRLSAAGALDAAVEMAPPTTQSARDPGMPEPSSPAALSIARDERNAGASTESGAVRDEKVIDPPRASATVIGASPVLSRVSTTEDRSLTIEWQLSAVVGNAMVVATATPGGRFCASDAGRCVIRGLDPAETYIVTVALKDATTTAKATATSAALKPVIVLKAGKIASPTSFVRPASKGKATWKVRGGCTLNATNTRLTASKSPTTCQLSVTTAKLGSTPKTTKSVTIVVKK